MKILAIGDFHGEFPKKLRERIKEVDLIISSGDFADTSILRDIEFKNWDKIKEEGLGLEEIVGKVKYKNILKKTVYSTNYPLKVLKSFNKPIITVYGNSDFLNKEVKKYGLIGFEDKCKALKIKILKTNLIKINNFYIAGFSGYRDAILKGLIKETKESKSNVLKINKKWEDRLDNLFERIKKPERTIFIAHDPPLGYFDKVNFKASPLNGKHVGDGYFLKYLKKYQPSLMICGHMHEYQGIREIGKTNIISVGPAYKGKAAIIEIDGERKKFKSVRFLK